MATSDSAKISAFEEQMKLRDEHINTRFNTIGDEIDALDRRFTSQISALDHKIDANFQALRADLRSDRERDQFQPSVIKTQALYGLLGLLVSLAVIAGTLVGLMISPVKDKNKIQDDRIASLEASRLKDAFERGFARGETKAYHEWLRDDDEAQKQDLRYHIEESSNRSKSYTE